MTEMPEKAIARARQLPENQQNTIAAFILEEIEDEAGWDTAFARSHDMLERLATEAREEDRKGLTNHSALSPA